MATKNKDDTARIVIIGGDQPPETNTTLLALLRDGEKVKPGDPRGTLADRLGAELQGYIAEQMRVAKHRRTPVKGKVVLTISTVSGPDGSLGYAVDTKITTAKIPPGASMTFTDEDGELTGRPVEPLTEKMYERERAQQGAKAEPMAGASSKL